MKRKEGRKEGRNTVWRRMRKRGEERERFSVVYCRGARTVRCIRARVQYPVVIRRTGAQRLCATVPRSLLAFSSALALAGKSTACCALRRAVRILISSSPTRSSMSFDWHRYAMRGDRLDQCRSCLSRHSTMASFLYTLNLSVDLISPPHRNPSQGDVMAGEHRPVEY